AKLTLPARQYRARFGIDKKLRDTTLGQPPTAISGHLDYCRRLALDGNLTRPRQRWATILTCVDEGSAIRGHLLVAQLAQYGSWQDALNEEILVQHHRLAFLATKSLEDGSRIFRPIRPGYGLNDRLHVGDSLDAIGALARPIETQEGTPIVEHQNHPVSKVDLLPQREQIGPLFVVAVAFGPRVRQLVGASHPDQITSDQASEPFAVRHDVAPQVG